MITILLLHHKSALEKVNWTPECEAAFQTLKNSLTESPKLYLSDLTTILHSDAFMTGLRAILLQDTNDPSPTPVPKYLSQVPVIHK